MAVVCPIPHQEHAMDRIERATFRKELACRERDRKVHFDLNTFIWPILHCFALLAMDKIEERLLFFAFQSLLTDRFISPSRQQKNTKRYFKFIEAMKPVPISNTRSMCTRLVHKYRTRCKQERTERRTKFKTLIITCN